MALGIIEKVREANEALVQGDTILAMACLADVITLAGRIQTLLKAAKDGDEVKRLVGNGED